jgi:hypothetical protein
MHHFQIGMNEFFHSKTFSLFSQGFLFLFFWFFDITFGVNKANFIA